MHKPVYLQIALACQYFTVIGMVEVTIEEKVFDMKKRMNQAAIKWCELKLCRSSAKVCFLACLVESELGLALHMLPGSYHMHFKLCATYGLMYGTKVVNYEKTIICQMIIVAVGD